MIVPNLAVNSWNTFERTLLKEGLFSCQLRLRYIGMPKSATSFTRSLAVSKTSLEVQRDEVARSMAVKMYL